MIPLSPSVYPALVPQVYIPRGLPTIAFFPSLALFAFWLRSSVVSVLFSLISEIVLRDNSMIKFIFGIRWRLPVLAYSLRHRVTGLTLPPVDANLFHHWLQLVWSLEEEVDCLIL